ncbi:hypothetical protein [Blastococcus sp. Marseille-P5729]|uniref:hypothetical protein n=1 Tax=Blastococcus sp. Marseille-P5729 TaxID=2086582 RepID=UPI00131B0F2C|nr:hypothetical protein [Blastococcus sp. Marseille-P5729]
MDTSVARVCIAPALAPAADCQSSIDQVAWPTFVRNASLAVGDSQFDFKVRPAARSAPSISYSVSLMISHDDPALRIPSGLRFLTVTFVWVIVQPAIGLEDSTGAGVLVSYRPESASSCILPGPDAGGGGDQPKLSSLIGVLQGARTRRSAGGQSPTDASASLQSGSGGSR